MLHREKPHALPAFAPAVSMAGPPPPPNEQVRKSHRNRHDAFQHRRLCKVRGPARVGITMTEWAAGGSRGELLSLALGPSVHRSEVGDDTCAEGTCRFLSSYLPKSKGAARVLIDGSDITRKCPATLRAVPGLYCCWDQVAPRWPSGPPRETRDERRKARASATDSCRESSRPPPSYPRRCCHALSTAHRAAWESNRLRDVGIATPSRCALQEVEFRHPRPGSPGSAPALADRGCLARPRAFPL